ncbi:MAG: tetratricopeptide repeat protein, partial [Gammaproteobacteria bacterium]|nr:tetratricopeptide repeat protein [Gammaproteobacteria bacterium]
MSRNTKESIKSLLQSGRIKDAKKLCQSFCNKNNDAEGWFMLGTIYAQTNEYENAVNSLIKSISIQNNVAITHHNLGLVYLHAGKPGQARSSFEEALKIDPRSTATRLELANALQSDGAPEDAILIYEAILESSPNPTPVLVNLASAYTTTGRFDKAIRAYKKLLKLQGDSAETLFMLGNAYRSARDLDAAKAAYQSALQVNPRLSGVLNNLGLTLSDQGLYKDAERCFNQSLEIEPRQSDSYINLAKCHQEQRQVSAARTILERALVLHPEKPEIHWDLSLILLKLGQFEEGWKEYEWRLKGKGMSFRSIPLPIWHGEDISKKTILVTAEQGIGDEIMFSSCYPDMIKRAAQVVIDCEDRLAPLFKRSFPECDFHPGKQSDDISQTVSLSDIDVHISAGSIPQHLHKHKDDFPIQKGYLSANPDDIDKWKNRYSVLGGNINVGISWKGGHISKMEKRSTSMEDWLPLLKVPGISFINLQYGDTQADIDIAREISGTTIHHWDNSDPLKDMDNFAAQISALDLVISVDNS